MGDFGDPDDIGFKADRTLQKGLYIMAECTRLVGWVSATYGGMLKYVLDSFVPLWVTPNMLTVARIVLAPMLVFFLLHGDRGEAIVVFIVGACFDLIDGPLARQRGVETSFGKMVDPVADRLFFLPPLLLALFSVEGVAFTLGVALMCLEVLLAAICMVQFAVTWREGRDCAGSTSAGRIKTDIEAVAGGFYVFGLWQACYGLVCLLLVVAIVCAAGSIISRFRP